MFKKIFLMGMGLVFFSLFLSVEGFAQEDKIGQVAIDTFKTQILLPQGTEIKFIEKKESPIPDFYSVKLLLVLPDKEKKCRWWSMWIGQVRRSSSGTFLSRGRM